MSRIHYTEYNTLHTKDFVFHQPGGHDCWLLLLLHTPAVFFLSGTPVSVPANSAVLFAPGTPIHYQACQDSYSDDWLRFESSDPLVASFPLKGIPFLMNDPQYCCNLLQLLTWEHSFPSAESAQSIDALIHLLFVKLTESTAEHSDFAGSSPLFGNLLQLRREVYNNPQLSWNVPAMADQLHISTGYLQSLYKTMFSVSCMEDVIASRIRLAKDQLLHTEKTICEIADFCGYHNTEHFCRQFRKMTGTAPGLFRQSMHQT